MNKFKPNRQQQEIIDCPIEKNILVKAGAGSGKTTVLTERLSTYLKNNKLEPNNILVLTFTNNSAHDMKTKIVNHINELETKDVDAQNRIDYLKTAIYSSHIQTFDSFAQDIVRKYAFKLNIPNTFFIANDYVLEAKKREILTNIFKTKYEKSDSNFIELLKSQNTRDDSQTIKIVLDLYKQLHKFIPTERENVIAKISNPMSLSVFQKLWNEYSNILSQNGKSDKLIADRLGDLNQEYERYKRTFPNVNELLNIYKSLDDAIEKYKKENCMFTFDDIAVMALSLLTEDKFKDIAAEVRKQFIYIMIDEFQDTNEIQYRVICSLLEPKEDGSRSFLFCVGDEKQSIYSFRNAKIEIFRKIEDDLRKQNAVYHMTYSYRSNNCVIDDVNTIFLRYMTSDKANIDYSKEDQKLVFPSDEKKPTTDKLAGLHIITTNDKKLLTESTAGFIKKWECQAIINDIYKKVNIDKTHKYNDFYVITRTKSNTLLYEREFAKAGIPLNNKVTTNLVEINAIMLINSFINLLALYEKPSLDAKDKEQMKHIFASLARSYVYKAQYEDQKIIDLIKNNKYKDDSILTKVKDFYNRTKGLPFSQLFIKLIDEFNIVKSIYQVGEVENNIAKIESLYQLILSIEQAGGMIKDFAELLKIISKHRLEIKDETISDVETAVTLMTIHQSKGLEHRVVYLPNSVNHLGKGNSRDIPDYDFDSEYGILLPMYDFDKEYRTSNDFVEQFKKIGLKSSSLSIPHKLFDLKDHKGELEKQEHIRLFYVAMTRAKESIYIVGYPKCEYDKDSKTYRMLPEKTKGTLFDMLNCVWGGKNFPVNSKDAFPIGKWEYAENKSIIPPNFARTCSINKDNKTILFNTRISTKASQLKKSFTENLIRDQKITEGNELHAIMERINFNNPGDLSFIKKKEYKDIVEKILNDELFAKTLKDARYYHEFICFDNISKTKNYIDLLAIKDGIYYIIDWKLSDIDKKEYEKQMQVYQKNIQNIFKINTSKMKIVLVSLKKQEIKIIKY